METPLKRARLQDPRKPSQDHVAKEVGITQSFYLLLENGKRGATPEVASALATYFGVPVDKIFTPARYTSEPEPLGMEA